MDGTKSVVVEEFPIINTKAMHKWEVIEYLEELETCVEYKK